MSSNDRPSLRPYLGAAPENASGQHFVLHDLLRLSNAVLRLNYAQLELIQLFDGNRTVREIQSEAMRHFGGILIPLERITGLVEQLDDALFLDSVSFRDKVAHPIRQPSCLGAYHPDPEKLQHQLTELFLRPGGAGLPTETEPDGSLRGVLVPHIDYGRGGVTYTHAFREVYEKTNASLFVIIGTSHYSRQRFTLTRKHFQTPFGVVETDQSYIDKLVSHYGEGLFRDEWIAHFPEHSIELEVVFLQYLYQRKRDIRIVPLVVGSFQDCIESGESPYDKADIQQMITALQTVEKEVNEPICYIISGDLAHIGPKFGDHTLSSAQLSLSRYRDEALLKASETQDLSRYFAVIQEERDARRICGLPPMWITCAAMKPCRGKVLHYDQYVHPQHYESVSFASMGLYR